MTPIFKYTKSGSTLTENQRNFYEKNGYLVIKKLINENLIDELRQHFIDICENKSNFTAITVMKDPSLKRKGVKGEFLINKVQDWLYDEIFWKYSSDNAIIDVVKDIIGPNVTAMHSMFINKPPDAAPEASLHPLHQDFHYFPFRPAEKIVASWTALETTDERNGCLYVIPGSHCGQLLKHEYPKGFKSTLYHGISGLDHLQKEYLVMDKGDTVFFHPILLHGSGPNYTKGFRKAISCHYADSNCYFVNVKGTIQEEVGKEVENMASKFGIRMEFANVWKFKSRLVCGTPGNFQKFDGHL